MESLEYINAGIKVNGEYVNNIRYAYYTVVFAEYLEEFWEILVRVAEARRCRLSLNT